MDEFEMLAFEKELEMDRALHSPSWGYRRKAHFLEKEIKALRKASRTYRLPIHRMPPHTHYVRTREDAAL